MSLINRIKWQYKEGIFSEKNSFSFATHLIFITGLIFQIFRSEDVQDFFEDVFGYFTFALFITFFVGALISSSDKEEDSSMGLALFIFSIIFCGLILTEF